MAGLAGWLAAIGLALVRILLGFYGFWLVWRVLLPWLPGPEGRQDRIAPYAGYFTDPTVVPMARVLKLPERAVAVLLLVGVAAAEVALARLSAHL